MDHMIDCAWLKTIEQKRHRQCSECDYQTHTQKQTNKQTHLAMTRRKTQGVQVICMIEELYIRDEFRFLVFEIFDKLDQMRCFTER